MAVHMRHTEAPRRLHAKLAHVVALSLALAGCFECRPGDKTTTNGRDLCPPHEVCR